MKWATWMLLLAACTPQLSEVAFTVPEPDLIPEGIAYDPMEEAFFVGSTFKRKVVQIDRDGAVRDFTTTGQDGLWGIVGMEVDVARRVLWVASSHAGPGMPMIDMPDHEQGSAGIFKYDLATGGLIRKYVMAGEPQRHFFNDVAVTSRGTVYITDSAANAIYQIEADTDSLALFIQPPEMPSPNGIALSADERYLFVALRGDIGKVNVRTGALSLLARPEGISVGADGLYFRDQSLITVWPGSEQHGVTRYVLNATLDTVEAVDPIIADHPVFLQPTTGVVVGSNIYVVANSQLQVFRRLYAETGTVAADDLKEPVILRVTLR